MDSKQLIDTIVRRTGRDRAVVSALHDALCEVLTDRMADLDQVAVPGFGVFETKQRAERVTVHPSTGKKLLVPPKIVASFRPSAMLKQKLKDSKPL